MKYLSIVQGEGEVVVNVDGDIIHVQLDEKYTHKSHPRLDEYITMAFPITYDNLVATVLELVDSTNKIQAIKMVRRLMSPMGLREAKGIVDTIVECNAKDFLDKV